MSLLQVVDTIPEPIKRTITTGLCVWAAIAFFLLYVFRNRYCNVCGDRLRFRERAMDEQGYDLCDRHRRFTKHERKDDDDDFTDNPHI